MTTGSLNAAHLAELTAALAGRYRLERVLGAGGMATVWLAEDVRHRRRVAVKVLHPELSAVLGPERFLKEIELTASLQHPHILPLFDSGRADGLLYYVMPYVEGQTLRERLELERQLPVADAVRVAREVADALVHAHAQGIIHRDIKPENILLQDGHAIVADFGIALAVQTAGGARMTQTGLSLGTPQYMAPEQAIGERTIDHRVDQYALAAVTYELLTGEPPHTGSSAQAIVARMLSEPVRPATGLRPAVPVHVDEALRIALASLPADRFPSVRAFADALRDPEAARPAPIPVAGASGARGAGTRARRPPRMAAVAVALAAAAAGGGWLLGRRGAGVGGGDGDVGASATRFVLELPPGVRVPVLVNKPFAIAPDGSGIAYAGSVDGRTPELFFRPFDATEAQRIPGTAGATDPAFSPDGRWIGCIIAGQVAKVPVTGGAPTFLAPIPGGSPRGLAWLRSGELLFGTDADATLFAVPEGGGAARKRFTVPDRFAARWPIAIPGSEDVVFTAWSRNGAEVETWAGSPASGEAAPIGGDVFAPLGLVGEQLLYVTRTGELMAVRYDRSARRVAGTAVRVLTGVLTSTTTAFSYAAVGPRGDLVYLEGAGAGQLVGVRPGETARVLVGDTASFEEPRVSPDGTRLAVTIASGSRKAIWLLDRTSGILSRLTDEDPSPVALRDRPEWSVDGRRVLFRIPGASMAYSSRPADRSEAERRVPAPSLTVSELVMHPDGRTLLGRVMRPPTSDLAWWTLDDTTLHEFTRDAELETGPRFSPDGRWVAYSSSSSGQREVFVSSFPALAPVQVSRGGGGPPAWGRDGRTVYYPRGKALMASRLDLGAGVRVTDTRQVLEAIGIDGGSQLHASYDVGPGDEIVFVRPVRDARTVVIRDLGALVARQGGG
jgi:serine/threonine-protein kinase